MNTRTEYIRYDKDQLVELCKYAAMLSLVGKIYIGKIHGQEVRVCDDGSIEVFTKHEPIDRLPTS